MRLAEDGRELSEEEYQGNDGLLHTLSYVGGLKPVSGVLWGLVDADACIPPEMGAAMRQVIREQMEAAGITQAIVRLPREDERPAG